jgi:hypothetical protein
VLPGLRERGAKFGTAARDALANLAKRPQYRTCGALGDL